ncbi:peptide-methionine (S)-S-oxide reductase MsrA [Paenibacillus daejeonensis]|uniref:peptide-methionine (S)-S-oxide reductase MsrA n=1 Tax=Paenibacillus daejeonensis TaxID=135193 RepID=UPI00037B9BB2|nr:peptide-methionine (S)-S-oxide reductase MsrA [Paenibacillus daejeonensis]
MDKMRQDEAEPWQKGGQETATFGLGCFWSPEAYFGHLPGVIRTRVGYAGGTAPNPTYREMGDHTETVQVDYEPQKISYEQLLALFWDRHNPNNLLDYKGNQYRSLILFHDEGQQDAIRQYIRRLADQGRSVDATSVAPCQAWYRAEERHQKYYLQRYPDALAKAQELYRDRAELLNSTLAARLNGIAKGFSSGERVRTEIKDWPVEGELRERLIHLLASIRW